MAKSRQLFRRYAQSKGKEAVSFVELKEPYGYGETNRELITKDSDGYNESTQIYFEEFTWWLIKNNKIIPK